MKILFVSSGNAKNGISPIVKNQGEVITCQRVHVEFFTIKGKGLWSYLRHIFILRKYLKTNTIDIVHAHYSLSAYVASFAGAKPLVVSLMGSDVKSNSLIKSVIYLFSFLFKWKQIIVKSEDMKRSLMLKKCEIIPNGVNLDIFKTLEKCSSQKQLGWDGTKKHILFAADPNRPEKNFKLASEALSLLNNPFVELHVLENISHGDIPTYMNASDLVILSSLYEGSPNVIKEAMACNCSIVATDVGDIKWVLGETKGCYIASFNPADYTEKIKLALKFNETKGRTKGRERLIEIGLDSATITNKITAIYKKVLKAD